MKNIPNFITVIRLVLSVFLFFITDNWTLFLIIYFLCGASDVLDGFLARQFHLQTRTGARLDSLADFLFFFAAFFRMLFSYGLAVPVPVIWGTVLIALIRFLNLFITKKKFRLPGILHTIGNKLSGIIFFFACPAAVFMGSLPVWVIFIPLLSALEETFILLKTDSYDPDIRSFHDLLNK
ncbi:CDP-alcohol phosphatidyltransferase family protein [Lacrimispora amygdalina]|uniref:CDP-alcohol phosphatidyltransferase family protein n=1 Tax=Lacrimispora amygdalina TaxID=253257 RepID=A0A3E2N416_9FIRM|nr:CDP-alcohol phosphatidyltransferase family protein [Clostridium indicum]RFZ75737.1 CDP-alcohol phosphatidyltransferase family protein [Clostridium indicum]